jgi:hypothetical protein
LSPVLDLAFSNQFQLTYGRRFLNGCTKIPLSAGWAQEDAAILLVGI